MRTHGIGLAIAALLLGAVEPGRAGDVRGRVAFEGPGRPVVFLRGNGMVTTRRGGPRTQECTIRNGVPEPRTLLLRTEDRVRFTNGDPEDRRLFLFAGDVTLDLGLLAPGGAVERAFPAFGAAEIYTDSAPEPAVLLILENPYHVEADTSGSFLLDGVTPGAYDVWAWLPVRRMDRAPAEIPFEGAVEVGLTLR